MAVCTAQGQHMSDQGGDTRIELMFRLEAALKRIEALEEQYRQQYARAEYNLQRVDKAADRIEALENENRELRKRLGENDELVAAITSGPSK